MKPASRRSGAHIVLLLPFTVAPNADAISQIPEIIAIKGESMSLFDQPLRQLQSSSPKAWRRLRNCAVSPAKGRSER